MVFCSPTAPRRRGGRGLVSGASTPPTGVPSGSSPPSGQVSLRITRPHIPVGRNRSAAADVSRRAPTGSGAREVPSGPERGRAPSSCVRFISGPVPVRNPAFPARMPPVEPAVLRRAPPSTAKLRRYHSGATRRRFPARPAAFLPPFSPACRWPPEQIQPRHSAFLSTPASPHSGPESPSDSGESEANPYVLQRTNTPDAPEVQTIDRIQKSQTAEYQP
jgi:hypothetical protein